MLRELKGHGGSVYSAAFSADGARIVTASGSGWAFSLIGGLVATVVAHALPWRFEGSPPSRHGRERPNARLAAN
jgi:hypothetical protein